MAEPGVSALHGGSVRSVDRAAALLLALGESQGEAGVTELATQARETAAAITVRLGGVAA